MSDQKKLDQLHQGQLIQIRDPNFGWHVKAPLPESFGYTVGSEIGTPFSGYATEGNLSKVLALQFGVSNRVGLVTRKIYQGPEPTEVSMDLNFNAYYSARKEVVAPIIKLMLMSVGHEDSFDDVEGTIADYIRGYMSIGESAIASVAGFEGDEDFNDTDSSRAAKLIRFMRTPGLCAVKVGNVFRLSNVYISNVSPTFSNVLDHEFLPMSATCSITIELSQPMSKIRIAESFGMGDQERENIESTSAGGLNNNQEVNF